MTSDLPVPSDPCRLTEVLKMAARSAQKDAALPAVALDLLKLAVKEQSFQMFWGGAVEGGLLKEPPGPAQ